MPTLEQLVAALAALPEDPILHFSLANAYRDADRLQEAAQHYRLATTYQPDYSAAWFEWARVAERQGDLPAAREAYEGAMRASEGKGDDHILKAARVRLLRLTRPGGTS
jgi:predicted Zn-dependent protease